MKRLKLKFLMLLMLTAFLLQAPVCLAAYVIDADLSDWGVTPFVNWLPVGTADHNETDNVNLYGAMGYSEYYDFEALYFDDDLSHI